jgi:hypothetical protein
MVSKSSKESRNFLQFITPITAMIYPTPPPFSSHIQEKNAVTSKKPGMACQNKRLRPRCMGMIPG